MALTAPLSPSPSLCPQHFRLHLVGSFLSFGAALLAVFVRDIVGKALGGYVINFSLVLTFYMTGFVAGLCEGACEVGL